MSRISTMFIAVLLMMTGLPVNAEQSRAFDDYTVHYAAFTTDILSPEVARLYKIRRSKNRALINISVLKKVMGTTGQPVRAQVEVAATNLSRQLKSLKARELSSNGAIYYIAETAVNNAETLNFDLTIVPEGESEALSLSFQQQFFTD